ncbi:MAG TPA: proton-conducting transporter membrane subunit [Chitinophagales bacterium]|nr:proton-conducting transporter membrane subunit [Chitinophagales bacterium]
MIIPYLIATVLISAVLFFNRNKAVNYLLVALFSVIQWVFTIYNFNHRGPDESGYFNADALALLLLTTLSIIAVPAFFHSHIYIKTHTENPRTRGIYFSAMTALVAAMSAAYLANHIGITWVFVEITTLAASALIYHRRNIRSLEGTWKYIFVCSISITFVFIGILFLSIALQREGYSDLSYPALISNAATLNIFWLRLAFIFIFTGFTAKLGLVPMYTAGIDAKDKAPSPAGALFSSALMNMGFAGIFRFYEVIAQTSLHSWANKIIFIAAVLSVFVATVYMLKVKNIKRMFAYSSIEHMGIVSLGLAAGGIGYYAAILHIILHAFTKSSMFFQHGQIYRIYQSKSIYDVGNYFKYNLTGALVMLLAFICGTAMPPSGLFISEFMIFRSLFEGHYIFVLVFVLILLTMIIWAFGKNIFKLLFTPPVGFKEEGVEKISPSESLSQFILLGLVIYLGFNPPPQMVELINEAVKNLPK